ncbi:conserved hypothetical protein [Leishmania mexicana MHOM/GT/2001/U1103]|uniref:Uncharacterized protein n=1 Tax=Leishmania mexicana (strain MHOM/GT/2001/U1103) TaxID=929439 RepID=E9B3R9_LEIMU|nr:conserved hypothetical protein [Leishmania mexicana MHOM/GT/2001/U1103]CBZ29886.1 conserved hypothetical protein [Leishmania mexicana MHOM/GT/2001/U1103]
MENPFEDLRPALRSEEDEIRKGVFSQALRNLQQASLEERRRWCKAIREATARGGAKAKKKATTAAAVAELSGNIAPSAPVSSPPQRTANTSAASASPPTPSALTAAHSTEETDVAVGQKRARSEGEASPTAAPAKALGGPLDGAPLRCAPQALQTMPESTTVGSQPSPTAALAPADGEPSACAAASDPAAEETEESVKECIAAYMRSLLDRVVGTGIDNLAVPALKVLCMMLGIHTEVSSKLGLYSILADFYFSKCVKLGKRVSRDTVFERHVEQEVSMLRRVASASSSVGRAEKKVAAAAPGKAAVTVATSAATLADKVAKTEVKKDQAVVRKKMFSAPLPNPSRAAKAVPQADPVTEHYLKYEDYNDNTLEDDAAVAAPASDHAYGGDIIYQQPVFARPNNKTASRSHMAKYEGSGAGGEEEDSWSLPLLERKVASIVQLYDPVTVAIVVKKLSQMGYRDGGAESRVEQILRRFHDRQLIFYDNGIAYLM